MYNIKISFSYDGSKFFGSQKQLNKNTVANVFIKIFKSLGINEKLLFSGRTDKNVHAMNQIASIKIPSYWSNTKKLETILKQTLPSSIRINYLKKVSIHFHPRFSAKKRIYKYIISTNITNPFLSNYISYHPKINYKIIQLAIKNFIGVHDFAFYSKKGSYPVSTIREIYNIKFYKYKEYYIFSFKGNSFLRSQIRMMVEMLLRISDGKNTIHDLINQLNKTFKSSKKLASPNGLYLWKIIY